MTSLPATNAKRLRKGANGSGLSAGPMTGSATKQSIAQQERKLDCFAEAVIGRRVRTDPLARNDDQKPSPPGYHCLRRRMTQLAAGGAKTAASLIGSCCCNAGTLAPEGRCRGVAGMAGRHSA
jgi:hypothetical protein